jgi:hypothetical protein
VSAGVAGDGHALAGGEVVAVAHHQFDGGARGVATIEQPAEVGGCGAECGELPGGKEPLVLGSEAPVCLMPCHGGNKILVRIAGLEPANRVFSSLLIVAFLQSHLLVILRHCPLFCKLFFASVGN